MNAVRMRVLMISLFLVAAILVTVAGDDRKVVGSIGVACFFGGVAAFFSWRLMLR